MYAQKYFTLKLVTSEILSVELLNILVPNFSFTNSFISQILYCILLQNYNTLRPGTEAE